ncbi:elongation factor Ts [Striga asiatica]|uniref:Elongation factor Ts n=1 Tax=Striga asiatica TaxID=4170 RepID=A0A5A7R2Y4_STRAF|nr:elongation factor Ts [Striga asiatica]
MWTRIAVTLRRNLHPGNEYCTSNPKTESAQHNFAVTDSQIQAKPVPLCVAIERKQESELENSNTYLSGKMENRMGHVYKGALQLRPTESFIPGFFSSIVTSSKLKSFIHNRSSETATVAVGMSSVSASNSGKEFSEYNDNLSSSSLNNKQRKVMDHHRSHYGLLSRNQLRIHCVIDLLPRNQLEIHHVIAFGSPLHIENLSLSGS